MSTSGGYSRRLPSTPSPYSFVFWVLPILRLMRYIGAVSRAILRTQCPDAPGLIATVTGACMRAGFNIVSNAEHVDRERGEFCMRTVLEGDGDIRSFEALVRGALPAGAAVTCSVPRPLRIVIMVTREAHCLGDLLVRWFEGAVPVDIAGVVGNHDDLRDLVARFDLPFHHVSHEGVSRQEHEREVAKIVDGYAPDLVVLAKYMRVLSPEFVSRYPERMLNIHHSFLPAFVGARPYAQAFARGVKIIGATAHFVTDDLDEGPIVTQDVIPVGQDWSAKEMALGGRDVEKIVLARAIGLVAQGRVFVTGNRTVVL